MPQDQYIDEGAPSAGGPVSPRRRPYWAERHGAQPDRIAIELAAELFGSVIAGMAEQGYLQKWFGYHCVDEDEVPGLAGTNATAFAIRRTLRSDIWPISERLATWDEAALLTAIEFMHDHVSQGVSGRYHDYLGCGWHYAVFDDAAGQRLFRTEVNSIIDSYGPGYEIGTDGEVIRKAPSGMESLVSEPSRRPLMRRS